MTVRARSSASELVMPDMDHEQPWFTFALPESIVHVPADSEEQARRQMQSTMYPGCPWPFTAALVDTRFCSRPVLISGTHS